MAQLQCGTGRQCQMSQSTDQPREMYRSMYNLAQQLVGSTLTCCPLVASQFDFGPRDAPAQAASTRRDARECLLACDFGTGPFFLFFIYVTRVAFQHKWICSSRENGHDNGFILADDKKRSSNSKGNMKLQSSRRKVTQGHYCLMQKTTGVITPKGQQIKSSDVSGLKLA